MRAVVQRVGEARVRVDGEVGGEIGRGLLVLLGAGEGDGAADVKYLSRKIPSLRIFEDGEGKMNLGLEDIGGAMLVVSQFTLYGDTRKGRRPSFVDALEPTRAEQLVEAFVTEVRAQGFVVETGRFGATMKVELVNEGPVTLILESRGGQGRRLAGGGDSC